MSLKSRTIEIINVLAAADLGLQLSNKLKKQINILTA